MLPDSGSRTGARWAGIPHPVTPHTLRHTYAFRLAKAGVPIIAISKLLGHSSIVVTQRYIDHLTESEVAQYAPSMSLTLR